MALATDKQYIKTYGRLPWWRSPVHFQKPLKRLVGISSAIEKEYTSASLHWTRDEAVALIHSVLAEHPDWNVDQIKQEMSRRRGILQSEILRRAHPVPSQDNGNTPSQDAVTFADTQVQPELNRELTTYEKKVDFASLDTETKKLASQGTDRVKKLLIESRDKLLALIAGRHKAGSLTTKFVLDLELRGLGQLIPTLREVLGSGFRLGQREAAKELKKTFAQSTDSSTAGGVKPAPSLDDPASVVLLVKDLVEKYPDWTRDQIRIEVQRRLKRARGPRVSGFSERALDCDEKESQNKVYQVKLHPEGLPPEKALEFFERKAVLWGADIRQPLLGDVKNILFDGIKQGTSLRDLMTQIGEAYLPWLGDPDQMIDETMLTPYRLETLVRTNITEALNEGRKAQFQSAVDDGFVIGLQYSAVLDQRTTEVCRYLDQKVFEANSPDLDRLTPPRHYNCFVDGQTVVYTAKGWKQIAKIEVGDLVLTDKGRMQPVTCVHHKQNPQKYDGDVVKILVRTANTASFKGQSVERFLTVTPEHPVLVNGRWVCAGEVSAGDSVACLGSSCQTCGKVIPWLTSEGRGDALVCCGRSCFGKYAFKNTWNDSKWRQRNSESARLQMHREYSDGTRDRFAITKNANQETRKRYAEGRGVLVRPEVRAKALKAKTASTTWWYSITEGRRGDNNPLRKYPESAKRASDKLQAFLKANPHRHGNRVMGRAVMAGHEGYLSKGHRKLYMHAQQLELGAVELEFPIKTTGKCFYADVAFPEHQIALEFDGSYWHQDEDKDRLRDVSLAEVGWKTLRYRDVVPAVEELRADLSRVMANHNGEYVFTSVIVEKVERWKLKKARRLYNLSVLGDESFIAKGFVVHNCRSVVVPITRMEGPVQYITQSQVAKGIELSGKGFSEGCGAVKSLEFDPNESRDDKGRWTSASEVS